MSGSIQAHESWAKWGWIVERVAGRYGVPVTSVLGSDRGQLAVRARRDLCTCLYASGLGYSEIGRMVGRDHTSVMYAVRKELGT